MANIDQIRVGNVDYNILSSGTAISENYSITETAVGTWIDGKTIWQKVIKFSINGGSSSTKLLSDMLSNVKDLIDERILLKRTDETSLSYGGYTLNTLYKVDGTTAGGYWTKTGNYTHGNSSENTVSFSYSFFNTFASGKVIEFCCIFEYTKTS